MDLQLLQKCASMSLPNSISTPDHTKPEGIPSESLEPGISALLAAELLDAVDDGSSSGLLEALSRIALTDLTGSEANESEREKLELLRTIAVQMRVDLHAMLMHIYQRLEASRSYLTVVRHLAGRPDEESASLWQGLPGIAPRTRQEIVRTTENGNK
jgi:hypothetical protein